MKVYGDCHGPWCSTHPPYLLLSFCVETWTLHRQDVAVFTSSLQYTNLYICFLLNFFLPKIQAGPQTINKSPVEVVED